MVNTLVTVCLPVFNDEKLIRRAVDSILNQTYKHIEILISDNQSEDKTYEILQTYKDNRIKLTQNKKNLGWQGNSNKLLKCAQGDYIVTLHGDDYYQRKDYIEKVVEIFEKNISVGTIHFVPIGDAISQFKGQGLINKNDYIYKISSATYMPAPTVTAYRKDALLQTNYYSKHYWSCEVRLSIELGLAGFDAYIEGDNSYFYRYQGVEKDSQQPLKRVKRLEELYVLFKDLKKNNEFEFDQKSFEQALVSEINFMTKNLQFEFYSREINEFINCMLDEGYISQNLHNLFRCLVPENLYKKEILSSIKSMENSIYIVNNSGNRREVMKHFNHFIDLFISINNTLNLHIDDLKFIVEASEELSDLLVDAVDLYNTNRQKSFNSLLEVVDNQFIKWAGLLKEIR